LLAFLPTSMLPKTIPSSFLLSRCGMPFDHVRGRA
jgi:hypothetical protein